MRAAQGRAKVHFSLLSVFAKLRGLIQKPEAEGRWSGMNIQRFEFDKAIKQSCDHGRYAMIPILRAVQRPPLKDRRIDWPPIVPIFRTCIPRDRLPGVGRSPNSRGLSPSRIRLDQNNKIRAPQIEEALMSDLADKKDLFTESTNFLNRQ